MKAYRNIFKMDEKRRGNEDLQIFINQGYLNLFDKHSENKKREVFELLR